MTREKPIAVISKATTPGQVTVTGTLSTIARRVADANLVAPAVIVVGDVVALRDASQFIPSEVEGSVTI
jgi:siroheme synthase